MSIRTKRNLLIATLGGCAITCLAVFVIAILIVPKETRSDYFWFRLAWTEFLALIVWLTAIFYSLFPLKRGKASPTGGISPSVVISVLIYATLSFLFMLLHAWLPKGEVGNTIHLVSQIILFTLVTLSIILLNIARIHAAPDIDAPPKGASPEKLAGLFQDVESYLSASNQKDQQELLRLVQRFCETLKYSLSGLSGIASHAKYEAFSKTAEELAVRIPSTIESKQDIEPIKEEIKRLNAQAKAISKEAKR